MTNESGNSGERERTSPSHGRLRRKSTGAAQSLTFRPDDFQPANVILDILRTRQPPPTLYHYTDTSGLVGIVQDETLWLSHTRFLNDRSESEYARDLVANILRQRRETTDDSRVEEFLKDAEDRAPAMYEGTDLYVVCFCEEGDLLSQWRGYSKGAGMFSLGFASDTLSQPGGVGRVQYSLFPIVYRPDEQRRIINEMITRGTRRHLMQIQSGTKDDPLDPVTVLMLALGICMIFFKDESFGAEREWRTVVLKPSGDADPPVRFRTHPWYPMPYVEMYYEDGQLPLVEVMCGPAPEPDLAIRSVELLLRENGYGSVPATESRIPLRW